MLLGIAAAAYLGRRGAVAVPSAWAWPMALALVVAPVIYPWYLVWLVPFVTDSRALPVWLWTVSILAIYPSWHDWQMGAPLAVSSVLLWIEFAMPLVAIALLAVLKRRPGLSVARGLDG